LLESRLAPATITVTTTADDITPNDGSVSLREAITAINAGNNLGDPDITAQNPGTFGTNDKINFNIPGTSPLQINVGSSASAPSVPLPNILKPVVMDGTTQAGFSGTPLIVLNGANAGAAANGLDIQLGAQVLAGSVVVKSLVINQFTGNGIVVGPNNLTGFGITPVTISGNYVGTNAAGTAAVANLVDGIFIDAGNSNHTGLSTSNNLISNNVISGNGADGVEISAGNGIAAGNTLTGNFIGTNAAGTAALANAVNGVFVAASGNNIGAAGSRNVISGNAADGILIGGTLANPVVNNTVANNFVGVDSTGNVALGNQSFGIEVSGGNSNSIGGNVVGGNSDGIEIDNGGQTNIVEGNFVGVGANGSTPVGNKFHGIALRSGSNGSAQPNEPGVRNNLIGGLGLGDGNTIAFNAVAGVAVFGNPVALSGQANTGNTIEGNSIFQNGRSDPPLLVGIDLSNGSPYPKDDGFTPNDSKGHGAANDPNNFQDFPVLSSITPTGTGAVIQGALDQPAAANVKFRIDFYASNADPQSGVVEGQFFLGSGSATTNTSGLASFAITVPTRVAPSQLITATATDSAGNTSEFSLAIATPNDVNQFYVGKVYQDLLGRAVDPGGLNFWTAQLDNGLPRSQMVLAIETDSHHEYYSTLVRGFYPLYLHRAEGPGDQAGATNFVHFLAAGGPIEQIRATFTASPEYFQTRGGNTASGFVNALYLDAFGTPNRVATDPGAAAFATAISNGTMNTSQVSLHVFNSDEFHFDLVQSYYRQFLNRTGTANELNGWVAQFRQGAVDQTVIALILGSQEAFVLAFTFTPPAPALRNPNSMSPDLYGPVFNNVPLNGRSNLNDVYVFRSPADPQPPLPDAPNFGNTVLTVTVSPFAGALTPISFDPRMTLDLNVVNTTGHLTPDFTFQVTFAPPTPAGQTFNQVVTLRLIQGNTTTTIAQYTYVGSQTIPPAFLANNITFPGDAIATGKFIAGVFDDPSFFDAQGYAQFARTPSSAATPFPRPAPANPAAPLPTDAKNFYHNANILALVLEVPTTKLTTANPPLLGAWADSKVNGVQVQRVGRPLLDALLIPPVPRTDLSRGDRRTAFNQGSPATDVANFRADMIAVLTSPNFIYQRSLPDATALVDAAFGTTIVGPSTGLLPDMLTVNLSKVYTGATNGFPNGHRLRDDVVDTLFNLLTNGKVTTDNVSDDNGTTITDGLGGLGATTLFPYIGRPNSPSGGGNP
jgi:CSLREA domain-containing protein